MYRTGPIGGMVEWIKTPWADAAGEKVAISGTSREPVRSLSQDAEQAGTW